MTNPETVSVSLTVCECVRVRACLPPETRRFVLSASGPSLGRVAARRERQDVRAELTLLSGARGGEFTAGSLTRQV